MNSDCMIIVALMDSLLIHVDVTANEFTITDSSTSDIERKDIFEQLSSGRLTIFNCTLNS